MEAGLFLRFFAFDPSLSAPRFAESVFMLFSEAILSLSIKDIPSTESVV
jgi:hypothetical protein